MAITKDRICEILKKVGVPYFTSGKNVCEDSVNINCMFCRERGDPDPSDHLCIFEGKGSFYCWRCKNRGSLKFLLRVITGLSRNQCEDIIDEDRYVNPLSAEKRDTISVIDGLINTNKYVKDGGKDEKKRRFHGLPELFESITKNTNHPVLNSYMNRRSISLDTLIEHGCGICRAGKLMNRMIIPVMFKGTAVASQAADLTGRSDLKYKTDGDINSYLYNYDKLRSGERIIITEGILDAWRVGENAVATFGTHITNTQMRLITDLKPCEVIFAYDTDYYLNAIRSKSVPRQLSIFVDLVKVVAFPEMGDYDPDSYGKEFGHDAVMSLIDDAEPI